MSSPSSIAIIIPMAGEGKRFQEHGYRDSKPFIPIQDKPMIAHVLENLSHCAKIAPIHFYMIARTQDLAHYAKETAALSAHYPVTWIARDTKTQGAACTSLLSEPYIPADAPLLIANSDQWLDIDLSDFLQDAFSRQLDGSILTFPCHERDPKWSYIEHDMGGYVTRTAEKDPISTQATVGLYYFKHSSLFMNAAQAMIQAQDQTNDEYYVCPTYNYLPDSCHIGFYDIPPSAMHGLGTPEDLERYLTYLEGGNI